MSEGQHLRWGAEALWQQLEPLLPGLSVEVLARTDSTNTRLIERNRQEALDRRDGRVTHPGALDNAPCARRSDDVQPALLVAEQQTQGRGRFGRQWQSAAGASLTFSLALPLAPADWSGLSLAVGVALAEALEPAPAAGAPRIGLKWPNDLWLVGGAGRGRKLGGVLIETVPRGESRLAVVGVGVNVLPQSLSDLSHGYACLQEIDAQASAPAALATVALPLVRAIKVFERDGLAPFLAGYGARDLLAGQRVGTTLDDVPEGVAEGIDAQGALLVRHGGMLHAVAGGEVSVRLQGPDAC
jgi:BirA family biotin operon repressor/biotin-[acetyl-CoA-carboxylase] ligase